ncbi:MAG: glycosyltransferase family 4 protein [Lachnospiraceae bacterium]|jgi:glycosyltransferase involved in cell wall biosynthesis|nr:glycosyltransferase family 4 protein [Lachnospiraceae bacterium]MCI1656821.1 glycosyltransferase family 4 protein [Lachnospiraceae bacterium]MCI2195173.1 glycosyltransferase family 4 protein [Lachnospiraceae bacterium]
MTIHIIYQNYLNREGTALSIGGIQTYISNLSDIFIKEGYGVCVHQQANKEFSVDHNGIRIKGYKYLGADAKVYKYLYSRAKEHISSDDLLIFGDDAFIVENKICKTIAIQHGVFWDKPERLGCSRLMFLADYLVQSYRSWKTINRIKLVDQLVCVDYNFVNWYRALVAHPQLKLEVIPNFSAISEYKNQKKYEGTIKIIFARRFFEYRGTRIFADAISRILEEYKNIYVTVAGEGPDEQFLHERLDKYGNVEFIKYQSQDSLKIHADKHIALVPTLGSEGTSLSLLEAMASQCAVICTNVGGMTNLVIDHYNGLMIAPESDDLYRSIKLLLNDRTLMAGLARKAYEITKESFSLEVWQNKWKNVIAGLER